MKFISKINFPQKSIFGFKVLSSFSSSITAYGFLLIGKICNQLFGFSQIQIISGSLFNIVLNISIIILVINLIIKRNQIETSKFILLNAILFIYLPIAIHDTAKYITILFYF